MRPITEVLVPTDFSDGSLAALHQALSLVRGDRATLHLLHVIPDVTIAMTNGDIETSRDDLVRSFENEARAGFAALAPLLENVEVRTAVREGNPARVILMYAKDVDADLIVMGTQGRGALSRMIVGSTAEAVVLSAPCPVLTVHSSSGAVPAAPPEDEATPLIRHGLRVRDVMRKTFAFVRPHTPLKTVLGLFLHADVCGLPVVSEDGQTVGWIESRPLLERAEWLLGGATEPAATPAFVEHQRHLHAHTAADVMEPLDRADGTVDNALVVGALRRMLAAGRACVPVIHDGHLIGILHSGDVLRWLSRHDELNADEQPLRDSEITHLVRMAIEDSDSVAVNDMHLFTDEGHVYLYGNVSTPKEVEDSACIARHVPGVHSVENNVHVHAPLRKTVRAKAD